MNLILLSLISFGLSGCMSQDVSTSSLSIPYFSSSGIGSNSPPSSHPIVPNPTATPGSTATPVPVAGANTGSAASYFASNLYFNQAVDTAAVDSQSSSVISNWVANGGWGAGAMKIDESIDVYYTDANTVRLPFQDNGMIQPDTDTPTTMPVAPSGGTQGFESSTGRAWDGGDSHYLAMDLQNNQLTEVYQADATNSIFATDQIVVFWPFAKTWLSNFRGDVCTSADAGGLMIAPMLASAEEINAGLITHAMRMILPNSRIAYRTYVRPATHTTGGPGWADANTGVPYGARFRLKSSFNIASLPTAGARTVATAMKKYGLILADGGNIALTFKSDAHSTAKYGSLLGTNDLTSVQVTDLEMVEGGTRIHAPTLDCTRNH